LSSLLSNFVRRLFSAQASVGSAQTTTLCVGAAAAAAPWLLLQYYQLQQNSAFPLFFAPKTKLSNIA